MSHMGKHRKKVEDFKHSSRSNVFERLGDERNDRKHEQEKYYMQRSKQGKHDDSPVNTKFDHIKKKSKVKSSSKDSLPIKAKGRKHEYIDEPPRQSSKVRREFDEPENEYVRNQQHHSRSKFDEARGQKRKVARSRSSSSSVSPPRQAKHLTKRQRYQSPSPEPSYRPKDQERGRSRERRGKKMYDDDGHSSVETNIQPKQSHRSVSKKHIERIMSPHEAWDRKHHKKDEAAYKMLSPEKKKYLHVKREEAYSDDSFSRDSKRSSQTDDLSERSYGYGGHHQHKQDFDKYDKKHKQQKKEKALVYPADDRLSRDYYPDKKHEKAHELDDKPKKKKFPDRHDDRSTSSHYAEVPSHELKAPKKKRKDFQESPPSPARSLTPEYRYKKDSTKYAKHLPPTESDDTSDVGLKKKIKMKKKKKHKMEEEDLELQRFSPHQERRTDNSQDMEEGRAKKMKKRKRNREGEREERSRSVSEERIVKKQRLSSRELKPPSYREDLDLRKEKRREGKPEKMAPPILRRSPGLRELTPPRLAREKLPPPPRRVLTPERSDSRHRQKSPGRPIAPPVLHRSAHTSLERDGFKQRDERRDVRSDPYVPDLDRRTRSEDARAHKDDRRRHVDEISREPPRVERRDYESKGDRFTEKKLTYEELKSLQLLSKHLNAEKRKPAPRPEPEFVKRDRPPAILERRHDLPPVRSERSKPNWKPQPAVDPVKHGAYRDRNAPPIKSDPVRRVHDVRTPPFEDPPRPRRMPQWADKGGPPPASRERNVSKERWPQGRRPIDDLIGDARYKSEKKRSLSRDRSRYSSERKTPTVSETSGTYREVRRSGDQTSSKDLRLEVTIHDSGSRPHLDKTKRKPHSSERVVAYDKQRPPAPERTQRAGVPHSKSGTDPRRADTSKQHPSRSGSYQHKRVQESSGRHSSHERLRGREYLPRREGQSGIHRGEVTKLPMHKRLSAPNRDRSHASSASRSSTRSPRRLRRQSPPMQRSDKLERKASRSGQKDSKQSSDRLKKSKEKKAEPSSLSTKQDKKDKSEAADVLDIDWTGLDAPEKDKEADESNTSSVLSRFTPANVLLRMGVSSKLLPADVLQRVEQKCGESKDPDAPPLVLDQGLGALNRKASHQHSSWLSNFADKSRGVRMTSFSDASYRQQILRIGGDLRMPTYPPYIINARTYSASIKHYLSKTVNKIPIEVQ